MNENLIHTEKQSNVRNKILKFYGNNKVLIFSFLAFFIVFSVIFTFYIETNEKKKKIIAENYITAKIYLENNERDKAKNILKEIVFTNNSTYSTLSLFLLLNEDLISDSRETFEKIINFLCKHVEIKNNKEKLINSINSTHFDKLKKYENKYGFNMGQKNKFFHLGKENDWRHLLDPKINIKINNQFKLRMQELGYI